MPQNLPGSFQQRQQLEAMIRQIALRSMRPADAAAIAAAQQQAGAAQTAAGAAQQTAATAQTLAADAIARTPKFRLQVGTVTAIALGASVDVPITWSTPFPNANYDTDITAFTGLIGRATCAVKSGSKTVSGCTVTVTASLLVSAGSQFIIGAVLSS